MYVQMYWCVYIYVSTLLKMYFSKYEYVRVFYVCFYVNMNIYVSIYVCIDIFLKDMFVYMCVYMYLCIYIFMCVEMCKRIHVRAMFLSIYV